MKPDEPMEDNLKRPTKRARVEEENTKKEDADSNDKNEEDLLLSMLESGNDEEEEAERRRRQRRQRWKKHDDVKEKPVTASVMPVESEPVRNETMVEEDLPKEEATESSKPKDDEDDFDMFSSSVSPIVTDSLKKVEPLQASDQRLDTDCDDAEGYYKAVIGETISMSGNSAAYKVLGVVGKGVFSTVLKCSTSTETVAIKCVRNNETMAKAAQTEIQILQIFQKSPHPHIVPMLHPTAEHPLSEHRGHVLLVFEYHEYNLRDVLQKFGKGVGLSLVSVQMYFGQLLSALHHLQKHSILHADIKLDNMLVSDDFSTLKICDFGSAMDMKDSGNNIPTPYLVSRFYRAPDIILGHTPNYGMDLWSVAVTIAELFLGKVLFNGSSNNDMLVKMMQILGPLPLRQIKHHIHACQSYPLPRHFSEQHFLQQAVDPVTGRAIQKQVSLQKFPTTSLQTLLLKAKSSKDSRLSVQRLADLLKKCLALDPGRRISIKEALHHEFFQPKEKDATQQAAS